MIEQKRAEQEIWDLLLQQFPYYSIGVDLFELGKGDSSVRWDGRTLVVKGEIKDD